MKKSYAFHPPTLATAIVALLLAVIGVIDAASQSTPSAKPAVQSALKAQAKVAAVQAQTAPASPCNVAPGQGALGACAPKPAFALAASLAKASGASPGLLGGPKGVDISSYQGCSNSLFGVSFVYAKFTESTGYSDRCAPHNIATAKARRIPYGGYDFLRPGRTSAVAEAQHFVAYGKSIGGFGSLPPVADVEANAGLSPASVSAYVCTWVNYVHSATGQMPMIYTGKWFWDPQTAHNSCGSKLWVSAYASSFYLPLGFARATVWQYSDGHFGPFPHINGWDSDVFLGSAAELRAFTGRTAPPAKPISKRARAKCTRLNTLRRRTASYHRQYHLKRVKPQSRAARRESNALRASLRRGHYACKVGRPGRRGTLTRR